ncbi:hypothetical protein HaLaN_01819, partial [Haematococcus lacustris]
MEVVLHPAMEELTVDSSEWWSATAPQ